MSRKNLGERIQNTKNQMQKRIRLINEHLKGHHLLDSAKLQAVTQKFSEMDFDAFLAACENTQQLITDIRAAGELERKRRSLHAQFMAKEGTRKLKRKLDDEFDEEFIGQVVEIPTTQIELSPSSSSTSNIIPRVSSQRKK